MKKILFIAVFLLPITPLLTEPVSCETTKEEYKRDEVLFLTGLVVIANVIQIFLEPKNIPKVKGHVDTLLQGIINFAKVVFKPELKPSADLNL